MCVFAEQSSAYDIVAGDGWRVWWGKGSAQSLELHSRLRTPEAVRKDTPGDFRGKGFAHEAGLEPLWVHLSQCMLT